MVRRERLTVSDVDEDWMRRHRYAIEVMLGEFRRIIRVVNRNAFHVKAMNECTLHVVGRLSNHNVSYCASVIDNHERRYLHEAQCVRFINNRNGARSNAMCAEPC